MRKATILYVLAGMALTSCTMQASYSVSPSLEDSLLNNPSQDTEIKSLQHDMNWDTVGVDHCGLVITQAKFVQMEDVNMKSVQLRMRNDSGKAIRAIKFKWYGLNAFEEPADCGSYLDPGFGGGFIDGHLSDGAHTSATWDIFSRDGYTIVDAWPTEIIYEDGTRWSSSWKTE